MMRRQVGKFIVVTFDILEPTAGQQRWYANLIRNGGIMATIPNSTKLLGWPEETDALEKGIALAKTLTDAIETAEGYL